MEQKKGKGRPSKGSEKRKQYNGTLEPIKIEVIGGTKECNKIAYEHLTKIYKSKL
jgi:hypothetical protein